MFRCKKIKQADIGRAKVELITSIKYLIVDK